MLSGLDDLGCGMNVGKTLFAQVMEYVPWKTFGRIIERHAGDAGVRTLDCADLFRVMAFAQLTWRESLRDIEACLQANHTKLFHMGLRDAPARSTLSDALNDRDWRIFHGLAMRLIVRARELYTQEPLAGRTVLQVDQAAAAHQAFSGHQRERGEDANLARRVHLCAHCYRRTTFLIHFAPVLAEFQRAFFHPSSMTVSMPIWAL